MKNFIYAVFCVLLPVSCTSTKNYTISGKDNGFSDGCKVYLCKVRGDDEPPLLLNSAVIAGNSFVLTGKVETPHDACLLVCNPAHIDEATFELLSDEGEPFACDLFLEPGEIHVTSYNKEEKQPSVASGTPLNDMYNEFDSDCDSISSIAKNDPEKLFAFVAPFIKANAANPVGAKVFDRFHWSMPKEMKLELLDSLQVYYGDKYAELKAETIEILEHQRRRAEQGKSVQPGNLYKDVVEKDAVGTPVSLQEIVDDNKGGYLLLEFWATWCTPCIREVPYLLDAYKEYADKGFKIYSVSLDTDEAAWCKFVEERNLQWINVRAAGESDVRDKYGIFGIPANFLINCTTGEIIDVNLGGDALLQRLSRLF